MSYEILGLFLSRRQNGPGKKILGAEKRTNKTQPTCDAELKIETQFFFSAFKNGKNTLLMTIIAIFGYMRGRFGKKSKDC